MRVITRTRLLEFAEKQPEADEPLDRWHRIMKRHNFKSFSELRQIYPSADKVGKLTLFNIGGNKYRLIVAIHYNRKIIYIRYILTHKEYDKNLKNQILSFFGKKFHAKTRRRKVYREIKN